MEDFRVDVVVGKGPGATAIPLDVEPFTLVGATTRAGLLTGPMRDRFGFVGHLDFYAPAELERVLPRSAGLLGVRDHRRTAAAEIAGRSRGTPRIANRLLRRVRDFAEVRADGVVTRRSRRRRCGCTTSTRSAWTGWTGRCCTRWSPLRRRPGRALHAGGGGGGGARDGRGGVRAVPGPGRPAGPHPARPGGHRGGLVAPGRTPPRNLAELPGLFGPDLGEPPPEGGAGELSRGAATQARTDARTDGPAGPMSRFVPAEACRLPPRLAGLPAPHPPGRTSQTCGRRQWPALRSSSSWWRSTSSSSGRPATGRRPRSSCSSAWRRESRSMTTSGIYGTVVGVDDTSIQLEVAPGTTVRVAKPAVGQVLTGDAVDDATTGRRRRRLGRRRRQHRGGTPRTSQDGDADGPPRRPQHPLAHLPGAPAPADPRRAPRGTTRPVTPWPHARGPGRAHRPPLRLRLAGGALGAR